MAGSSGDDSGGARAEGPGRRLRLARERRKLSVAEAADALHLDQATLDALEEDDFSRLPPLTFTRGYLRSYARLVGVPENEVLDAVDGLGMRQSSRPLKAAVGNAARDQETTAGMPLASGAIVILVAVVTIWWGWNSGGVSAFLAQFTANTQEVQREAASASATDSASSPSAHPEGDVTPTSGPPPAGAGQRSTKEPTISGGQSANGATAAAGSTSAATARAEERGEGNASNSPQPNGHASVTTPANGVAAGQATGSRDLSSDGASKDNRQATAGSGAQSGGVEQPDSPGRGGASPGEAVADSEPASPATQRAASDSAPAGDSASPTTPSTLASTGDEGPTQRTDGSGEVAGEKLTFEFSGESWMEVEDGAGRTLLRGLIDASGERQVRGKPPFTIVIGDVRQVSVRHAGKPVALQPYTRGQVAKFTLESR